MNSLNKKYKFFLEDSNTGLRVGVTKRQFLRACRAVEKLKSAKKDLFDPAVEGTKRVAGGFFDALTFNLFDFDKQNKVETKKTGGGVSTLQDFTMR